MAAADDIQAMLDDIYDVAGVPADWTPLGAPAAAITALVSLGDQVGEVQGVGNMVTEVPSVRVRVSEIAALTDGVDPASGDPITVGTDRDESGALVGAVAYLISGQPQKRDQRRLEWTIELARA